MQKLGRSGGKSKVGRRRLVERWWRYWHIELGKWHWKVFGEEKVYETHPIYQHCSHCSNFCKDIHSISAI